jgi:hypothetical protein
MALRAATFGDSVWWDISKFGGPALVAFGGTIQLVASVRE